MCKRSWGVILYGGQCEEQWEGLMLVNAECPSLCRSLCRGGTEGTWQQPVTCHFEQLSGRLRKMSSKFCLSARISAKSLSNAWIFSCCCSASFCSRLS